MEKKLSSIGGQALIEGVMMKSPTGMAMVVRKEDGTLVKKYDKYTPPSQKHKILGVPIIRGCVSFVESLKTGVDTMNFAMEQMEFEEEEPSKLEKWISKTFKIKSEQMEKALMTMIPVIAVFLSIGLFIALPSFISSMINKIVPSSDLVSNIIEGVVKMAIFLGYMVIISLSKDIKRVYMYHGAEHKTIACYEAGEELTVENAKKQSRLHARCGTNYLFLVMLISILFFSVLGFQGHWAVKIIVRVLCMPLVAGISYEVLKAAANSDSLLARIARYPGMQLQRLTTKEPDDDMLEVAIASFNIALDPSEFLAEKQREEEKEKSEQAINSALQPQQ